jgi:hypothetical protein
MVTTNLDTYFWLVDRLEMSDDVRNVINKQLHTVTLSKPFVKQAENGYIISSLMQKIHPLFMQRTGKQFRLPPEIVSIDAETQTFNKDMWHHIFSALEDFGIKIPRQKQDIIVKTT